MLSCLQNAFLYILAAAAGLLFWYDNCRSYWQKDLDHPMQSYVFPVLIGLGSIPVVFILLRILERLPIAKKVHDYLLPSLVLGITIPTLNLSISYVSFLLNDGLPKIYYIASDGISILISDSIILMVTGLLIGLLSTGLAELFSKLFGKRGLP
jgi:hypothetical protein